MKKCSKCEIEKELSEFYKKNTAKDGLRSECKECTKLYQEENKDRIKEYRDSYNKSDRYKELSKIKYINSGALSVAFLAGVNIYIIGILSSNSKSFLYIQSSIIFALSISLLMISILQYTNLTEINYMISNRISNELLFNFSIILNMVILINFILHTLYKL